ncbi:MAG: flagellar hook-basal body complex protein [Oscillospiraceae bacterium]|nr:flagellar hook-basal body complex protein [Oscillospiraceae bacterium]
MVRGLYIAGTGMLLQRRRMETITNNISNSDTAAYKKEHFVSHSFDEVLTVRINDHNRHWQTRQVGPLNLGTQVDQLYIDYSTGNLEGTERATDLALIGDSFFVMQTDAGERYTKTGHFYINNDGYLIDGEGNFLLGQNGAINVGGLDFSVDSFGNVTGENGYIDTIRVVSFDDNHTLRRQGSNLYMATAAPTAAPNEYRIAQGFLEGSNVDIGREMVDMLAMYRTYETNQRFITMIDETVGKAVNEIGRLR